MRPRQELQAQLAKNENPSREELGFRFCGTNDSGLAIVVVHHVMHGYFISASETFAIVVACRAIDVG